MKRRYYLSAGTAALTVCVAGCTGADTSDPDNETSSEPDDGTTVSEEFPPYPDSESMSFSGDGETVTDGFELTHDGPTILEVEHEGDEAFDVSITEADASTPVAAIPSVLGPYSGRSIHDLTKGDYTLDIGASGAWNITVYDLPAYEGGTGLSVPLDRDGTFGSVVGPIDFPDGSVPFEITFDSTESINRALLVDREGQTAGALFDNQQMESDGDTDTTSQTVDVSGVGYLAIESTTGWQLSIGE